MIKMHDVRQNVGFDERKHFRHRRTISGKGVVNDSIQFLARFLARNGFLLKMSEMVQY
jgi:hypothetical protein